MLARQEEARRQKEQRRQDAAAAAPPPEAPKPPRPAAQARLPHGSTFHVSYDADAGRWSGSLAVPGAGEFTGTATGVFRLLSELDNLYRQAHPSSE